MNRGRGLIGLSLLCALVFCAFAAPSAMAVKGTTTYTCVKVAETGGFNDEHCSEANGAGKGKWTHEPIPVGSETKITGTNQKTASSTTSAALALFRFEFLGTAELEFHCAAVHSTATSTNETVENAAKEKYMRNRAAGVNVVFSECTMTNMLAEMKCKLSGGKVEIKGASSETKENGMEVEFKPPESGTLLEFKLEGCSQKGFNLSYVVTGTFNAIPEGATLVTTEASTKGLKFGGKAGSLTTKLTQRMGESENPIATTTTEP